MRNSLYSFTGLFLSLFLACNSSNYSDDSVEVYSEPSYSGEQKNFEEAEVSESKEDKKVEEADFQRKIIKKGYLSFETQDALQTHKKVMQASALANAYVSEDKVYKSGSRLEYIIEIRVPSQNFESLLEQISGEAVKIDDKNISAQDVTEEFIDVESRIKSKKELENRYLQLLQKAQKISEILEIETEIGKLRAEIESMQGRLNYLKNRVSYSTLNVTFYEHQVEDFGFFSKLSKALGSGWENLMWLVLALAHLWPFALILVLVLIVLRIRKRKKS